MMLERKVSVKAIVIGGLCAISLALITWDTLRYRKSVDQGFEAVGSYIGACQEAGVLPSPEQLKERLAQIEAQAKAKEPEKK